MLFGTDAMKDKKMDCGLRLVILGLEVEVAACKQQACYELIAFAQGHYARLHRETRARESSQVAPED